MGAGFRRRPFAFSHTPPIEKVSARLSASKGDHVVYIAAHFSIFRHLPQRDRYCMVRDRRSPHLHPPRRHRGQPRCSFAACFEAGARATVNGMLPYVPAAGVTEKLDVPVTVSSGTSTLDLFTPSDASGPLPTEATYPTAVHDLNDALTCTSSISIWPTLTPRSSRPSPSSTG